MRGFRGLFWAPLLVIAVACGGRVVFDGGATSAGGAASTTTHATTATNTSTAATTGGMCLTTVTVGGGPQGPSVVHGTKCAALGTKQCPPASGALPLLQADQCYAITSVDDACSSGSGTCCYDVTEQLVCDG